MKQKQSTWLKRAVAISIIFHILMFFGSALLITLDISPFAAEVPPKPKAPPPPLIFELVETPESAPMTQPKESTKFISDRAARARNETSPKDLPTDQPFSDGMVSTPQIPEQARSADNTKQEMSPKTAELAENVLQVPPKKNTFSRDFLMPQSQQKANQDVTTGELNRAKGRNRSSRAPDLGSFSLNTYAWEFAPYLLRLKKKIEKHIFPPPAFTYMGMISGVSYLKFRITPDGKLEALEVLDYDGHKSLMETSLRAIEVSVPFEPLPKNFPENYLEITARFEYFVKR